MAAIPLYQGSFTLLYGDPEVREQLQYLQPLYGLTAADDPPLAPRSGLSDGSADGSLSRTSSSLHSTEELAQEDTESPQRGSIPGEPVAVRRQKHHPRTASAASAAASGGGHDEDTRTNTTTASGGPAAAQDGQGDTERVSGSPMHMPSAHATTVIAPRDPRRVMARELSLFPELCTGVAGPQPVFGGAALASLTPASPATTAANAASSAAHPSPPHLFDARGAPLLSSVVDQTALDRLRVARRPFPAPSARSGHVLLACPPRRSLLLYGGLGDDPLRDLWEYLPSTGRWTLLECQPAAELPRERSAGTFVVPARYSRPGAAPTTSSSGAAAATVAEEEDSEHAGDDDSDDNDAATVSDSGSLHSDNTYDRYSDGAFDLYEGELDEAELAQDRRAALIADQLNSTHYNTPPPAYGQAATLFNDANGDPCMVVLGGITVGDVCAHGFFALNLVTLTWRRLPTTMPLKDMWGATAQTLYAPRRYRRPPCSRSKNNRDDASSESSAAVAEDHAGHNEEEGEEEDENNEEEQVVVLFGGMTTSGEVIDPTTHILHLSHPLTAAEIAANEDLFLSSTDYSKREKERVLRHVLREENAQALRTHRAPVDDHQSLSVEQRCAQWRLAHPRRTARWRREALAKLEGKYWIEMLPATSGLHGRRRPTSAVYQRHFMYVFGGRDDLYFYNDLWCLNVVTRTWVQIRDGIPPTLLRNFLTQPHNAAFGVQLTERCAQLRRRTVAAVEAKLLQNARATNAAISPLLRSRDIHHALYSSSVNSTARARTGACMVADVARGCLYVYGGFAYNGSQHLTFFDLHAYYVRENVWRRVGICHTRPWSAALDAGQEAVRLVDPCEEARPYPRHCLPASPARLPLTLMGYANRHLASGGMERAAPACDADPYDASASLPLPLPPIVRRGERGGEPYCGGGGASDGATQSGRAVYTSEHFHLPSFIPEARTMAAIADDPCSPGSRFFLHGGRSGEEACGDLFELRVTVSRSVDVEYAKTQRAARAEAQAAAAAAAAGGPGSPPSGSGVDSPAAPAQVPSGAAAPAFTTVASTAAAATQSATAASTSQADATRLLPRSRRQLQRQLISAALESVELLEDAPAAHAHPRPRPSLRDVATEWIRDGIAAADPKALMFVELRGGRAVVNLRTHIHYSSRLSLLSESGGGGGASGGATAAAPQHRREAMAAAPSSVPAPGGQSSWPGWSPVNSRQRSSAAATTTTQDGPPPVSSVVSPQHLSSLDGHLKRSALSLEVLLYDVLLSRPVCNGTPSSIGGGGGGGYAGDGTLTSPCARAAGLSVSPDAQSAFPAFPLPGGVNSSSPGTSPGNAAPLPPVHIVSRAQYATPRSPQSQTSAASQLHAAPPLGDGSSPGSPPPAVARRRGSSGGSSSASASFHGSTMPLGSVSSAAVSAAPQPAPNNEYEYHLLLRSVFHQEPFCKAVGGSEKRR